jgi:hypothetical protein
MDNGRDPIIKLQVLCYQISVGMLLSLNETPIQNINGQAIVWVLRTLRYLLALWHTCEAWRLFSFQYSDFINTCVFASLLGKRED